MKIPEPEHTTARAIDAWHEAHREPPREHLGASVLGHACDRWLWLSFRWAVIEQPDGRVLRLFRRGRHEEATVIEDLRAIGVDVLANAGEQEKVHLGGHLGGSVDGIIRRGLPEAPKARHVLEIKTHGKKSFDALVRDGVEKAKPMHYVQVQVYMHGLGIDRALYVAVCKDDDRMHIERVKLDREAAQKAIERGRRIVASERLPPPISTDPNRFWYQCKFCPAHDLCYGSRLTREVNCRTCAHSTAKPDGTWRCEAHEADGIPAEFQRTGCEDHVLHPDLVPWEQGESDSRWIAVWMIDGKPVRNGHGDARCYTSREIIADPTACTLRDDNVDYLRAQMGARVIARGGPAEPFNDDIPF